MCVRFQSIIWRNSLYSKASQVSRTNHSACILRKGTNRSPFLDDKFGHGLETFMLRMGRCLIFGNNQWQFVSRVPDLPRSRPIPFFIFSSRNEAYKSLLSPAIKNLQPDSTHFHVLFNRCPKELCHQNIA